MEENQNIQQYVAEDPMLTFVAPKDQSSYIKVIGVGGGGGNAVNHMYRKGIQGVDFIVCNTDMKALNDSPVPNKIILGKLGAGGRPEAAKRAAEACAEEIREVLMSNTQMLFITAGLGGGTGTGAAPVIAEIAKQIELGDPDIDRILTIAIVTMPFSFEGLKKMRVAEEGLAELRKHVDSVLVINNDKLKTVGGDLPLKSAFGLADDVLLTAAKGIAEIITASSYVNLDFHDVYTVMKGSGTALMGSGIGTGATRAIDAIEHAANSVLLNDNNIAGAKNVLLYISASEEHPVLMSELGEITDRINELTGNLEAEVFWGTGTDNNLNEELCITLIATGFEKKIQETSVRKPHFIDLESAEQNARNLVQQVVMQNPGPKEEDEAASLQRPSMKVTMPDIEIVTRSTANSDEVPEQTEGRHIFNLYDNPELSFAEEEPMAEIAPEPMAEPVQEPIAEQVHESIVEAAPKPVEEPVVKPVSDSASKPDTFNTPDIFTVLQGMKDTASPRTLQQSAAQVNIVDHEAPRPVDKNNDGVNVSLVMTRSDRIKRMHDLLRNNPNGATIVENMTPQEMNGLEIYETPHSSESDAARRTIQPDGSIRKENNYLFGRKPD